MNDTQKYTARVQKLKILLPLSGLLLVLLVVFMSGQKDKTRLPLNYRAIEINTEGPLMREPVMHGVNSDKRSYVIKAASARPDTEDANIMHMLDLVAILAIDEGTPVNLAEDGKEQDRLTAPEAQFHHLQSTLKMYGGVVLTQSQTAPNPGRLETEKLNIDFEANLAETDTPVKWYNTTGVLTANSMRIEQISRQALFLGNVALFGQKQSTAEALSPAPKGKLIKRAQFTTDPDAPIEIRADKLEIFETEYRAVFYGINQRIKAKQGASTLYAYKAVLLTDKATGEMKQLYAKQDVLFVSQEGSRATGDWAEYDIRGNRIIMGGIVTLIENGSKLRGERLVIDMATGKSKLFSRVRKNDDAQRVRGVFTPGLKNKANN